MHVGSQAGGHLDHLGPWWGATVWKPIPRRRMGRCQGVIFIDIYFFLLLYFASLKLCPFWPLFFNSGVSVLILKRTSHRQNHYSNSRFVLSLSVSSSSFFLSAVPVKHGCQFSSSFITPSHYSLISFPSLFGHLLHKAISQQLMAGTIPLWVSVWVFFYFLSFWGNDRRQKQKPLSPPRPPFSPWSLRNESVEWTV